MSNDRLPSAVNVFVSKCGSTECDSTHIYFLDEGGEYIATATFDRVGVPAFVLDMLQTAGISLAEFNEAAKRLKN